MSNNWPTDYTADLTNTVKEMTAHLTTVGSQLEAQTKINDKLQAENGEFKAGKAKYEEKNIQQEERSDKLESRVDEIGAKNEEHTTMITVASD